MPEIYLKNGNKVNGFGLASHRMSFDGQEMFN